MLNCEYLNLKGEEAAESLLGFLLPPLFAVEFGDLPSRTEDS